MSGYVLDRTALGLLGSGNRLVSQLVDAAHAGAGRHLYIPALCLAAAESERSGVATQVGALPAVEVVELGFTATLTVGRLIGDGVDWRYAHAVEVARPSFEWPTGRPVLTADAKAYQGMGVATIELKG